VHDARSSNVRAGLGPRNSEPRGLLEILYAYTSTMANNGQVFGDLSANSPFYNLTTVVAMFMGRFALGVLALWLAGIFVGQQRRPATLGMLPKDALQFAVVIAGTALLVGGQAILGNLYAFGLLGAFRVMCLSLDIVRWREQHVALGAGTGPAGQGRPGHGVRVVQNVVRFLRRERAHENRPLCSPVSTAKIALTGHSGSQVPQPMHSSGLM
jgi:Potassium-transporting ATPase A subunit